MVLTTVLFALWFLYPTNRFICLYSWRASRFDSTFSISGSITDPSGTSSPVSSCFSLNPSISGWIPSFQEQIVPGGPGTQNLNQVTQDPINQSLNLRLLEPRN